MTTPAAAPHNGTEQPFTTATPQRHDLNIDALKGFLIIMVVLGHLPVVNFFTKKTSWQYNWLNTGIEGIQLYYFHMPLFFALGVFFVPALSIKFIKKTATALLIPYVIWIVQPTILFHPFEDLSRGVTWAEALLRGNWYFLRSILWFLPALFSCKIIFSAAIMLNKKLQSAPKASRNFAYVAAIVIWLVFFFFTSKIALLHCIGIIPFGIDIALYLMPYFIALATLYHNREKLVGIPIIAALLVWAAATAFITWIEPVKTITPFHKVIDLAQYSVPYTFAGYIAFTLLSAAIMVFFLKLNKGFLLNKLAYIGLYSFPIFLMHNTIIPKLFKIGAPYGMATPTLSLLFCLGTFVCSILFSIIFSKIVMWLSNDFKYVGFVK